VTASVLQTEQVMMMMMMMMNKTPIKIAGTSFYKEA
jgi:hypothetical protein